jgi:quinol monooxygenase YgiN
MDRLKSGVNEIRQREGCFGAQICELKEDPETIAIISRWVSQSALDQFLSSTTVQRAQAAELSTVPPTTETFVAL